MKQHNVYMYGVECKIIIHKQTAKAYYVTQIKDIINPVKFWVAKQFITHIKQLTEHQKIRVLHNKQNLKKAYCEICNSKTDLQLHHIKYTIKPYVITLCKSCHSLKHTNLKRLFK